MSHHQQRISRLLIANRGEIAVRIIRTCRDLGIAPLAIYSSIDNTSAHVRLADAAACVGPAPAAQSYLVIDNVLRAARALRADAIHPGYGFLSENADFAQAVEDAGLAWVGPTPEQLKIFGSKVATRKLASDLGLPTLPGTVDPVASLAQAEQLGAQIGYPILLKAVAGGGGKGMRVVRSADELPAALRLAQGEAQTAFGNPACFLEKFVESPHHVEVQVLGDGRGTVIHCGERECSVQRRHQKIVEEAPSPFIHDATRTQLFDAATRLVGATNYRSAGTVEFLVDAQQSIYLLEVNPRIQVEHPVTEWITGLDLIAEQIRVAQGDGLSIATPPERRGHAIECRITAEDPQNNFMPTPGQIVDLQLPAGPWLRVECGLDAGVQPHTAHGVGTGRAGVVPMEYDPMIAKLVSWGPDRATAIARMQRALAECRIAGIVTNVPLQQCILAHADFVRGTYDTHWLGRELPALLAADAMETSAHLLCATALHSGTHAPNTVPAATSHWQQTARREGLT